jgi:hypothetical protein
MCLGGGSTLQDLLEMTLARGIEMLRANDGRREQDRQAADEL